MYWFVIAIRVVKSNEGGCEHLFRALQAYLSIETSNSTFYRVEYIRVVQSVGV